MYFQQWRTENQSRRPAAHNSQQHQVSFSTWLSLSEYPGHGCLQKALLLHGCLFSQLLRSSQRWAMAEKQSFFTPSLSPENIHLLISTNHLMFVSDAFDIPSLIDDFFSYSSRDRSSSSVDYRHIHMPSQTTKWTVPHRNPPTIYSIKIQIPKQICPLCKLCLLLWTHTRV